MQVVILVIGLILGAESKPLFESTITGITNSVKGYIQTGFDAADKADSFLIDLIRTGNSAIDNRVLSTTSYLKQITFGTASEFTLETYHKVCSTNIERVNRMRKFPENFMFKFVLMTSCKNYTYSIIDAENMWKSEGFDPSKKTVILITGWLLTMDNAIVPIVYSIAKAYLCRGDVNFIAIDPGDHMNTLYEWAAYSTQELGNNIGKALSFLNDRVPTESIHLIGHSLGAHTAGAAARTFYSLTGNLVGRITGLDPANPCFQVGGTLTELSKGDAQYVDVIHTNPGVLGKKEALGDSDFYPNGFYTVPNGCLTNACAHNRAWEYYAESVYPGNENNFLSAKCEINGRFTLTNCGNFSVPMGYLSEFENGNYFLKTNYKSPFGRNFTSRRYYPSCGLCGSKYRY